MPEDPGFRFAPSGLQANAPFRSVFRPRSQPLLHLLPKTLERACGTSGASTARSGRHPSLAIDTDHPRTGHGQPFASAFRTRRINGLPLPAAPRAGALTECERVALLGPWAVRPRLPYVTLSVGTRDAPHQLTPREGNSATATVPSHPAPPRDVRETPSHQRGTGR